MDIPPKDHKLGKPLPTSARDIGKTTHPNNYLDNIHRDSELVLELTDLDGDRNLQHPGRSLSLDHQSPAAKG